MRIFIRQCLTETQTLAARDLIQEVLDQLESAGREFGRVDFIPGRLATRAKYDGDFRALFTEETGEEFTPPNFERWRSEFLRQADLLVAVRTAMSESTAVEIGRFTQQHQDGWERTFILLADTPEARLKTTLLKNAVVIPFATQDGRLADPEALGLEIRRRIFRLGL